MERDGLVVVGEDRTLVFTQAGVDRATKVMRKHRLAERLLTDVIGLDLAHVHEEACRWEHVMSERVERRLVEMLGHPETSPYGNTIPGLDEFDGGAERVFPAPTSLLSVVDAASRGIKTATLVRLVKITALAGFLQDVTQIGLLTWYFRIESQG